MFEMLLMLLQDHEFKPFAVLDTDHPLTNTSEKVVMLATLTNSRLYLDLVPAIPIHVVEPQHVLLRRFEEAAIEHVRKEGTACVDGLIHTIAGAGVRETCVALLEPLASASFGSFETTMHFPPDLDFFPKRKRR